MAHNFILSILLEGGYITAEFGSWTYFLAEKLDNILERENITKIEQSVDWARLAGPTETNISVAKHILWKACPDCRSTDDSQWFFDF